MSHGKIENKHFEEYRLFLVEKHRPPSRGGNTAALYSHVLTIDGERYSFLGLGSQQWVYKSDAVSFEFEIKGGYRNILVQTITVTSKFGEAIIRGNRGHKARLRTADSRIPASRREQRD